MYFVEITQDGAALLSTDRDDADGIFTEDVASCVVYAFYGLDTLCVIHDTGQLAIQRILKLASACGPISRAYVVQNSAKSHTQQIKAHFDRKKKIISDLGCLECECSIEIPRGAVAFMKDGIVVTDPTEVGPIEPMPGRDIRHLINYANNLFAEKNAQALPIDVQYESGGYTPLPDLLKPLATMLERARNEEANGDSDYLDFLNYFLSELTSLEPDSTKPFLMSAMNSISYSRS